MVSSAHMVGTPDEADIFEQTGIAGVGGEMPPRNLQGPFSQPFTRGPVLEKRLERLG